MAAASTMPYLGGAYEGLSAIRGVDYQNDDDPDNNQVDGHPVYRYGGDLDIGDTAATPGVANQGATMANEQGGNQNSTNRLEWTTTANFKLGWVGTGNWGNYTRTFPTPAKKYNVFAASSADNYAAGRLAGNVGEVTAGVGTATQTVQQLAVYNAPGTGAWSRNSLVGMREADGKLTEVELGGKKTIRWNYNGGDAEYLLFIPVTTAGTPTVKLTADGKIEYTGTLVSSPTVKGEYTPVSGATSPYTMPKTGAATFYQSK